MVADLKNGVAFFLLLNAFCCGVTTDAGRSSLWTSSSVSSSSSLSRPRAAAAAARSRCRHRRRRALRRRQQRRRRRRRPAAARARAAAAAAGPPPRPGMRRRALDAPQRGARRARARSCAVAVALPRRGGRRLVGRELVLLERCGEWCHRWRAVLTVLTISLAKHQFAYPYGQRPVGWFSGGVGARISTRRDDEAAPSARDNLTSTAYSSSSEAISEQRACSEASLLKRAEQASKQRA